ncbi:MAG: exodeoxyribonuclease VII small subunit [Longimicrobiales bacterium]|nr:exodeoxyribonuclease VII small subunit [Longimicrobiales bacterium]
MSEAKGRDDVGLEERLARLEAIVERLEQDELELQEALELFEEGIGHVRAAHGLLDETRLRVEKLVVEMDGAVSVEPHSPE